MRTQKDNFYVVTEEGGLFASFFGGTSKCYLLNSSGGILASYGESPEINQYFLSEFDSYYEDYSTKLSELLTYSPSVVYSTDNQLLLLESHSAIELLNYFQGVLFSRGCIDEKRLDEMFVIEKMKS